MVPSCTVIKCGQKTLYRHPPTTESVPFVSFIGWLDFTIEDVLAVAPETTTNKDPTRPDPIRPNTDWLSTQRARAIVSLFFHSGGFFGVMSSSGVVLHFLLYSVNVTVLKETLNSNQTVSRITHSINKLVHIRLDGRHPPTHFPQSTRSTHTRPPSSIYLTICNHFPFAGSEFVYSNDIIK